MSSVRTTIEVTVDLAVNAYDEKTQRPVALTPIQLDRPWDGNVLEPAKLNQGHQAL
jgi:hypothetical protein